ncbi:sugar phosphorylase [Enterococcus sp. LJL99]
MELMNKINQKLAEIYIDEKDRYKAHDFFAHLLTKYSKDSFKETSQLNQENIYLITYGDSFFEKNKAPLTVLNEVYQETLKDTITDIHLLPMFPYTSDDGFSVTDYLAIDPKLGTWQDIEVLAQDKRLMFDFVANHLSKSSSWFKNFMTRQSEFSHAFIEYDENFDTKNVTRPRTSPLFHEYTNEQGDTRTVWSTFSEDQVDVNVKNPQTLSRLTETLLIYAQKGATSIRLDAIGFLWKESGTTCMHLPQTHAIIQLWRILLNELAPNVQIITETNVPHKDNISYFGSGENEANQVYQFPLPPLVLHSFLTENAEKLTTWAAGIDRVSDTATFFNFLASHDGIGLRPTEGILTDAEREALVERVKENGGKVSYKNNPDGSQSVYELNINYSDALKDIHIPEITPKKMIAAHHILLSVIGVPAIYYHSLFGSKNDYEGAESSGINRRINREKLEKNRLLTELDQNSYRKEIYSGISQLIRLRKKEAAFSPYAKQEIISAAPEIFAIRRGSGNNQIDSYTNVSNQLIKVENVYGTDLISESKIEGTLQLKPYATFWIKKDVHL